MKMSEVQVGETYAYRPSKYGITHKMVVLETEVYRPSTNGYSKTSLKPDGVVIRPADNPDARPRKVMPRYFLCTWAEYEAIGGS